jgi:uncharacterized protein YdaL
LNRKIISPLCVCFRLLFILTLLPGCAPKQVQPVSINTWRVQGVRFDPSYYYNINRPLEHFTDSCCAFWQAKGINTLFFKAYDPDYGAVYKTSYSYNQKTDYSSKDFMRLFLDAAHRYNIRFMVWLPVLEHKGAWTSRPDWRIKRDDGTDLMPLETRSFLCVRNQQVVDWYVGFVNDILKRYPDIDGIDCAEPTIVWKNNITCECRLCAKDLGTGTAAMSAPSIDKRAEALTRLLSNVSHAVHTAGKLFCVTIVPTVDRQAGVLPFAMQKRISGLDPDGLLDVVDRPDWLAAELLWQQWANTYDDPKTFVPAWTQTAIGRTLREVAGRVHVVAHVELTPLGPVEVSPADLQQSISAARMGGAQSIELYDTHLADSLGAWDVIRTAWQSRSERTVFVLHDSDGVGAGRQVATLFGHFDLPAVICPVDSFERLSIGPNDVVAYVGTLPNHLLPPTFLAFAGKSETPILWMNHNFGQIPNCAERRGLHVAEVRFGKDFTRVEYKGRELFKTDSVMTILSIDDSSLVRVYARARAVNGTTAPYIVQSGNLWYVADCPVDYITEGCRQTALADILHDFLGEDHPEQHIGLVRIEDVNPLTDPGQIRRIADYLGRGKTPFAISLVPFYVDPDENMSTALSEKPKLVKALKYAIKKGAAIVMHGSTHQYRGKTTSDYEFWDELRNSPLFEDSDEYVRIRLQRGLEELHRNGIYPIVFETPHYAASQRDYRIIDQFFSAEYGRRQAIDKHGSDQLVPYFIARHPSGARIIPENLGYIPNDAPDSRQILMGAENSLALRDGYASFFFHPWIPLKVLRDCVEGIRQRGYHFADIRSLPLRVTAADFVAVTGNQHVSLKVAQKFVHTMYIDTRGSKRREWFSQTPVSQSYECDANPPPGWIFIAEGVKQRPSGIMDLLAFTKDLLPMIPRKTFAPPSLTLARGEPARVGILWVPAAEDSNTLDNASQSAWRNEFKNCGISVDTIEVERCLGIPDSINCLVVPAAAARRLSAQQALILAQDVAKGGRIILEGPSPLARQVGIRVTDSAAVVSPVKDEYYPIVAVHWPPESLAYRFEADVEYVTQYSDAANQPIAASGEYGDGMYLFFASAFADPSGNEGRFPFFLDIIERLFDLCPVVRSPLLEVWFDPGMREDVAIEELVNLWKKNGVATVHIAAWHEYATESFDYRYLLNLLHRNGMAGYAWFCLPHITEKFWIQHPGWREVTAQGTPAQVGWRSLMNLTNDTCRAGAWNAVKRLLMQADWDGVNLDGAMFEGQHPDSLAAITPMHPSFRALYQRELGYDPLLLFRPGTAYSATQYPQRWQEFGDFRDSLALSITAECISFLKRQKTLLKPGAEIILTRTWLDPKLSPTSSPYESKLWKLADTDSALHIQVRPSSTLKMDAAAMTAFISSVKSAYPRWQPLIVLNLDSVQPANGLTDQLCGSQLLSVLAQVSRHRGRCTFQTEDNLFDVDFKMLAYAAAAPIPVHISPDIWQVTCDRAAFLELNDKKNPAVLIDDDLWPAYTKGRLLLPQGTHSIRSCPRFKLWNTLLLSHVTIDECNAMLQTAQSTLQGVNFSYISHQPVLLGLSEIPQSILVDGLPLLGASTRLSASLTLPRGTHRVSIKTRRLTTALINDSSIGLSSVVVIISATAIVIFLLLYIGSRVRLFWRGRSKSASKEKNQ